MKEKLNALLGDHKKLLQAAAVLAVCLLAFGYAMMYVETHYKMSEAYTPDEGHYIAMAKRLLEGGGYSYWGSVPDAYVSPGYPVFLTVCMAIFGTSLEGLHCIKIVQAVLWALTVWLTWLLGTKLTGRWGVGIIAAGLLALNGVYAFYTRFLLTEIFYYFTMMLAFVLLHRAIDRDTVLDFGLAGVAFAVCVMVRPLVFVTLPVVFIPWIVKKWGRWKELLWKLGAFSLGFVLVGLPWWIRNMVTMGRFILFATQSNPIYAGLAPNIASMGIPDPGGIVGNLLLLLKLFLKDPWGIGYWMTLGKYDIMFRGIIDLPKLEELSYLMRDAAVYLGLGGSLFALWDKKLRWPTAVFWIFFLASFAFVPTVRYSLQYLPLLAILAGWLLCRLWDKRKE